RRRGRRARRLRRPGPLQAAPGRGLRRPVRRVRGRNCPPGGRRLVPQGRRSRRLAGGRSRRFGGRRGRAGPSSAPVPGDPHPGGPGIWGGMSQYRVIKGIGVSPGWACAPALVLQWRFPEVPDRSVKPEEVEHEVARLREAVRAVAPYLDQLRERVLHTAGLEESQIFEAQAMMVTDADFLHEVERLIRENLLSAETAFEFKALEVRLAWSGGDVRLRERLADLSAIQIRVLRHLMGRHDDELTAMREDQSVIVVAHELFPGLTVQLNRDQL